MVDRPEYPIPKTRLFEMLEAAGFQPSDDRFVRLRRAGLITDFIRVPGHGPEAFANAEHVDRAFFICRTIKRLNLEKPQAAEIAFWMSCEGYAVPDHLIGIHIRDVAKKLKSAILRFLARRASGAIAFYNVTRDDVNRLSPLVAKPIAKFPLLPRSDLLLSALVALFSIAMSIVFRRENFASQSTQVRQLLAIFIGPERAAEHARGFWEGTVDFVQLLFDLGSYGSAAIADDIRYELYAKGAAAFAEHASSQIRWFTNHDVLREHPYNFAEAEVLVVSRWLLPGLAFALFQLRNNEEATVRMEGIIDARVSIEQDLWYAIQFFQFCLRTFQA